MLHIRHYHRCVWCLKTSLKESGELLGCILPKFLFRFLWHLQGILNTIVYRTVWHNFHVSLTDSASLSSKLNNLIIPFKFLLMIRANSFLVILNGASVVVAFGSLLLGTSTATWNLPFTLMNWRYFVTFFLINDLPVHFHPKNCH